MSHCPKCTTDIPTHSIDPRSTSSTVYCPKCDTKLLVSHKEEFAATLHFSLFMVVTFFLTFIVGEKCISLWGANITLLVVPPLLLVLIFISYQRFNNELQHVPLVEAQDSLGE